MSLLELRGGNLMMRRSLTFAFLLVAAMTCSAQHSAQTQRKWEFLVEPYLMFPQMKGTVGVGTLPDVDVDATVNDIFSRLQSGFMLYAEAQNETWALSSDFLYMKLKQDVVPTTLIESGGLRLSETAWELAGLRKFLPWLEGGIGGRLLNFNVDAEIVRNEIGGGASGQQKEDAQTWFDPILVIRVKLPDSRNVLFQFRGDIGGFGIGSDFTWQMQAYGGYRFSDLFQVTVGYRLLAIDFKTGADQGRFLYDVTTTGPVLQIGFNL